jgi:uncharacterized Tic20 family protein
MTENIYGYGIIITFLTLILIDVFLLVLTIIRTCKQNEGQEVNALFKCGETDCHIIRCWTVKK